MLHFDMLVQRFTIVRNGCHCYKESFRYSNFTGMRRGTERKSARSVHAKSEKDNYNSGEIDCDLNVAVDLRSEVIS
jgi:hypothetical protein